MCLTSNVKPVDDDAQGTAGEVKAGWQPQQHDGVAAGPPAAGRQQGGSGARGPEAEQQQGAEGAESAVEPVQRQVSRLDPHWLACTGLGERLVGWVGGGRAALVTKGGMDGRT